jgi:hypothetical protein
MASSPEAASNETSFVSEEEADDHEKEEWMQVSCIVK